MRGAVSGGGAAQEKMSVVGQEPHDGPFFHSIGSPRPIPSEEFINSSSNKVRGCVSMCEASVDSIGEVAPFHPSHPRTVAPIVWCIFLAAFVGARTFICNRGVETHALVSVSRCRDVGLPSVGRCVCRLWPAGECTATRTGSGSRGAVNHRSIAVIG